jgi:PKD repeat protein
MHGDEIAGYVGMLHYIEYLLSNYGSDARVTSMVNSMEIWINPSANPDGTYKTGNNSVNGATRSNANNIDLNRNYPDPQNGPHPDGNAYQPETVAFMAFADTMNFVMSANFHGGAEVTNYPWDTWATDPADTDWWVHECTEYADTAKLHSPTGYLTSVTQSGVVNGFAWYEVNGGRQDYMNYYRHCREFTVELSNTKLLQESQLLNNWEYNYRSWLNYMEEALHGFRGIITDACTGKPIVAEVRIIGHDIDNSQVYSAKTLGNYHRPIAAGTYDVSFLASGYFAQEVGVNVSNNTAATVVNVSLSPKAPSADFAANTTFACGIGSVQLTDMTGNASSWLWSFGDGSTSTEQNPTHTYTNNGTYSVSLVVSNCQGIDTLEKINFITFSNPETPQVGNPSLCEGNAATLEAIIGGNSDNLSWYDSVIGGNFLGAGINFTTPTLSNTTVYYVENAQSASPQKIGPLNNSIGTGGYYTATAYNYLKFDANSAFRLKSVWVKANTAANRTIQLRNSAGVVLQSKTINIPIGEQRIELNFDIPIGQNWQLGIAGNNSLYRNQNGASFPYKIAGVASITGTNATNAATFYYFYDWEIQQICASPRVPVTVSILQNPPTAQVSQVGVTLVSSIATDVQWFSTLNGAIIGANTAIFTPNEEGSYYVVVSDAFGCSSISATIDYNLVGNIDLLTKNEKIQANHQINLIVNEKDAVSLVQLFDATGRLIAKKQSNESQIKWDVENLTAGFYFFKVQINGNSSVVKWVKI